MRIDLFYINKEKQLLITGETFALANPNNTAAIFLRAKQKYTTRAPAYVAYLNDDNGETLSAMTLSKSAFKELTDKKLKTEEEYTRIDAEFRNEQQASTETKK